MAELTNLSRDLGNIAKQNGRKGISSWMSRLHKGIGTTDDYTSSLSLTAMPINSVIGINFKGPRGAFVFLKSPEPLKWARLLFTL
ncbi:hypothetical protein [Aeromonas allosaccharophila]|uniref:hypothetical protein n=1 Tax=Aeromonas allosaccharophila TaxID=656 RepID=UPI000DD04314|nr:hypothetical protein [Aeromonas allosaccharophila]